MKSHRFYSAAVAAFLAASVASGLPAAHAGNMWVDNPYESIAVPLESPALGIARAQMYLDQQRLDRAEMALKKIIAKFPSSPEAHRMLAKLYQDAGKTELALLHEKQARAAL